MENSVYMGYHGERLGYVDRKKAKPTAEAYKYGRRKDHAANQKQIAIIAYGNRNGNTSEDDAWNFRGRGLLQITGKANYSLVQNVINKRAKESGVNVFDDVPETGYTPHQAAITGMAEWVNKSLHIIAQNTTKDNDDEIVNLIVDQINKRTASRSRRIVHYRGGSATANSQSYTEQKDKKGNRIYIPTKEIFKVNDCILITGEKKEQPKINGKRAPWVDIAIKEEAKIIRESTHCGYIKNTYHASTDNVKMSRCGSEKDATRANSAWCGAFVAYCLKTSGHKYQPDPGAIWHGKENLVKREKGVPYETQEKWGKKYTQMYIGGIVTWHNNGHTTIIIGIDKKTQITIFF